MSAKVKITNLTDDDKEQLKNFDCLTPNIECVNCPLAYLTPQNKERADSPSMKALLSLCLQLVAMSETWERLDPEAEIDMGEVMAIKNKQFAT